MVKDMYLEPEIRATKLRMRRFNWTSSIHCHGKMGGNHHFGPFKDWWFQVPDKYLTQKDDG